MTDQDRFRKNLTFSQRHGYEPLPSSMRLGELSNIVYRLLERISGHDYENFDFNVRFFYDEGLIEHMIR